MITNLCGLARRFAARLKADVRGLALTEFAFAMPVIFSIGMYGIEVSNLALTNLRVSQVALTLADNASRVGVRSSLSVQQLRESDINDVLEGARLQGENLELAQKGRVTVSSLQVNSDSGQWIFWQRCLGLRSGTGYDSSYGVEGDGATGTAFTGMGEVGSQVTAPPNSAVIFVEINYDYEPVVGDWLIGDRKVQYVASFIVRDPRDLTQIYNPNPAATPSTCDRHSATVPA